MSAMDISMFEGILYCGKYNKKHICALHWPGEKGPTDEFPDPLKANITKKEKEKASSRKRRNPLEDRGLYLVLCHKKGKS